MARVLQSNITLRPDLSNLSTIGLTRISDQATNTLIDPITNKLRSEYTPDIAIDRTYSVADITARDDLITSVPLHQGDIVKVASNNITYVFDGSGWLTITAPQSLSTLSDTSIVSPSNNQVLTYSTSDSKWKNQTLPSQSLAGLVDVALTSVQTDQLLRYDGIDWVNSTENKLLSNLTDSLTLNGTEQQGSTLRYNAIATKYDYSKLYHSDLLSAGTKSHDQLETDITGLSSDVATLTGGVSSLNTDVSDLDTRLTTAESTVSTNSTNIGTLQFVTSALQNVLTTKGDLWTHNGSAYARLPVGSTGKVLTADPATSTGLNWTTPSSGGTSYFATTKLTDATTSSIQHRQLLVNNPKCFSFGSGGCYSTTTLSSRTLISPSPTNIVACAYCPITDSPFYLATSTTGQCYKSSNNGYSWSSVSTNLSSLTMTGVAYIGVSSVNLLIWDTTSNRFVLGYIGSTSNVAYSNGSDPTSWTASTGQPDDTYGLSANSDFSIILVTTSSNKIYKSTDHAVSFSQVSTTSNYGITYSPTLNIFVATGDGGCYVSNTSATTWTSTFATGGYDVLWIEKFQVFVTVSGSYAYTSADGTTWTQRGAHNLTSNRCAYIQFVMGKYVILQDNNTANKFSYSTDPTSSNSWTLVSSFDQYFILDWHGYQNKQLDTSYLSDWNPLPSVATNNLVVKGSSGYTTATGLSTKGDILVFDNAGYNALPASTNGKVLSCNSGTTYGLQWIDPPAPSAPTTYLTKKTTTNATINVTSDTKIYELTVGAAGSYMINWYIRIWTNTGVSYARVWCTQDSSGSHSRTGTPFVQGDGDNDDFFTFNLSSAVTDSTYHCYSCIVTTSVASAKIAVWGGVYSGSWQAVNRTSDNTNYSGHFQATGPL